MKTTFKKHVLPNGLRVILIPRAESMTTNVLVMAETGSKYETKEQGGLSHFLEHMFFKGTKRRPKAGDISAELDGLGASFNAYTSQEYTGYYATVQPKLADKALDIISDMYLNSTFPETEIAKERGVIIEEINMYEDMPRSQVQYVFLELLYGDQPMGRSILGTKETVSSFTHEDFVRYCRSHYTATSTIVAIAGKFDEKAMLKKIEKQFKDISTATPLPKLPVMEKQTKPGILLKHKQSDQSHLVLGFRSLPASDPQTEVIEVLTAVLGGGMSSRLFQKIRDELGAAYYVRAYNDAYTDNGFLEISVGTDNKRVTEIIQAVLAECKKLTEKLVSKSELDRAKESMIGNLFLGLESSANLAGSYAVEEIIRGKLLTPEQLAKKIRAVTPAQVKKMAQQIFKTDQLNLAMIGPHQDPAMFEPLLRL